jgi:hypothetical protein
MRPTPRKSALDFFALISAFSYYQTVLGTCYCRFLQEEAYDS